jgi:hypothetical protein
MPRRERPTMMHIGGKHLARLGMLLGAAAVTAALGAAPLAAAAPTPRQQPDPPQQSCQQKAATQYVCQGPDNVQLNDPPSAPHYYSILG